MSDYTKQDAQELRKQVADKRESLRVFRFGGAGSRSRNVREGRNLRKEIARLLTAIRAKEIASKGKKD
jgi:ribosomal protein L29